MSPDCCTSFDRVAPFGLVEIWPTDHIIKDAAILFDLLIDPMSSSSQPAATLTPLGAGSVDAARAACIEAARKKGDQPIETENVRVLGEGRYEMSVRNKGTLGSSVTTCTYDKNIGAAIR